LVYFPDYFSKTSLRRAILLSSAKLCILFTYYAVIMTVTIARVHTVHRVLHLSRERRTAPGGCRPFNQNRPTWAINPPVGSSQETASTSSAVPFIYYSAQKLIFVLTHRG